MSSIEREALYSALKTLQICLSLAALNTPTRYLIEETIGVIERALITAPENP